MLLVKTRLASSAISGNGIFADQFIEKGTVIWDFHEKFDRCYTYEEVQSMDDERLKEFLKKYCYLENGVYILCVDDGRFMNHSDTPNTVNGNGHQTIANVDIQIGEEITCNYFEIDKDADHKLK